MFELENGDVLISQIKQPGEKDSINTSKSTLKVFNFNREKIFNFQIENPGYRMNNFYDQSGSCLLIESNFKNQNQESTMVQKTSYISPLEYDFVSYSKTKQNGNSIFIKMDVKATKTNIIHREVHLIHYPDQYALKQITEGEGFHRLELLPTYNRTLVIGDFAPLIPLNSGKKFIWSQPINHSYEKTIINPRINPEPVIEEGNITGEFKVILLLKKRTEFQISEEVMIEAFEFDHEYFLKYEDIKLEKNVPDTRHVFHNEIITKSGGRVARAGLPFICEMNWENKMEFQNESYHKGSQIYKGEPSSFKYDGWYRNMIEKAKEKTQPKMISEMELFKSFNSIKSEFKNVDT